MLSKFHFLIFLSVCAMLVGCEERMGTFPPPSQTKPKNEANWKQFAHLEKIEPGKTEICDAKNLIKSSWKEEEKKGGDKSWSYKEYIFLSDNGIELTILNINKEEDDVIDMITVRCPYDGVSETGITLGMSKSMIKSLITDCVISEDTKDLLMVTQRRGDGQMRFHFKEDKLESFEFFKKS